MVDANDCRGGVAVSICSLEAVEVQVLSETWEEDLRELREEVEGVRLWSKRSKASLRLDVFSSDSES